MFSVHTVKKIDEQTFHTHAFQLIYVLREVN